MQNYLRAQQNAWESWQQGTSAKKSPAASERVGHKAAGKLFSADSVKSDVHELRRSCSGNSAIVVWRYSSNEGTAIFRSRVARAGKLHSRWHRCREWRRREMHVSQLLVLPNHRELRKKCTCAGSQALPCEHPSLRRQATINSDCLIFRGTRKLLENILIHPDNPAKKAQSA
jgi:hypothetical protein